MRADPILPGQWLGLLGGGQLGRMFAMAAASMGYPVCVIAPDPHSPAAAVCDEHLQAPYDDDAALNTLAERCRAVTIEFENVPAAALRRLAERIPVRPPADAVAVAQDRIAEKRYMVAHGIEVGTHRIVERLDDLMHAPDSLFPGILKTARHAGMIMPRRYPSRSLKQKASFAVMNPRQQESGISNSAPRGALTNVSRTSLTHKEQQSKADNCNKIYIFEQPVKFADIQMNKKDAQPYAEIQQKDEHIGSQA